jgi:mannitol-1-phosphate/altronate dehydrogenase
VTKLCVLRAFDALIDVMHEARLVRFGAGNAHRGAAFHALRVFVETLGLVLALCCTA